MTTSSQPHETMTAYAENVYFLFEEITGAHASVFPSTIDSPRTQAIVSLIIQHHVFAFPHS
jgi:hypothetical protein